MLTILVRAAATARGPPRGGPPRPPAGAIDCPGSGLVICAFACAGRSARRDSKERNTS